MCIIGIRWYRPLWQTRWQTRCWHCRHALNTIRLFMFLLLLRRTMLLYSNNAQSTSKLQLLSTTHVIIAQATQFIRFYLSNYLHSKSEIYIFSHSKDKIYDKRPSTTFWIQYNTRRYSKIEEFNRLSIRHFRSFWRSEPAAMKHCCFFCVFFVKQWNISTGIKPRFWWRHGRTLAWSADIRSYLVFIAST